MSSINCIFVEGGPLSPDESSFLYLIAQHMFKENRKRRVMSSEADDTEIVVETNFEYFLFGAIGGVRYTAQISRGTRTTRTAFTIRPTKHMIYVLPSQWESADLEQLKAGAPLEAN